jgi:type I restriction enzyme S subunit
MEDVLPKNWVWLKFTDVLDIKGGNQPPKSQFISEPRAGYIRLLQIRDFGSKPVPTYIPVLKNQLMCSSEDILIARYGASIGRIVSGMEGSYNVALAKVIIPSSISKKFVKYYLMSSIFQNPITSTQRTAQNGFNKEDLDNVDFPLPPIAEQERIVAKLDALFAQHEAMKKALEHILKLLKDFRQQVLTQAVTGKLSEEWRKEKNLRKAKLFKLIDICSSITDGDHQAPPQVAEGVPFLVISNVSKGVFNFESVNRFVPSEYFQNLKATRVPKKGDVLYTVTGSYGIALLVDFDKEFCFQRHIAILRPKTEFVDSSYLTYFLNSSIGKTQADEMATGTAQLTVSLTSIKDFKIELPSLEEQKEIGTRVKSLFQVADIIETKYLNLKQKINSLPAAILHNAIKGVLVEQLPTDGDAKDLLEELGKIKSINRK